MSTYKDWRKREFKFNDPVKCVTLSLFRRCDVVGRLVQVRIGTGQFGSDLFMLRMPDGGLETFENEMIDPYEGDIEIPIGPDAIGHSYSICNKYAEVGFIIHGCKRPQPTGCFSMAIYNQGQP